jgi:hypothetical protein
VITKVETLADHAFPCLCRDPFVSDTGITRDVSEALD